MKRKNFTRLAIVFLLAATLQTPALPATRVATPTFPFAALAAEGEIPANVLAASNKAQRGRTLQAAVVMDIPRGLHVNSNRPLSRYTVATVVRVTAPRGVKVSPVRYPRAVVRKFEFSEERLAVYEGRAVMRFNLTFPENFPEGVARLRVVVNYQACSDTVCFQPDRKDMTLPIGVVGPDDPVQSINRNIFGGGRRRR
ncbi:MAG TPA: protein-disulfide reductase DsbD domain-containing protein [Pyrinomonadaceae bacterium]|nr:protein-disulfide reductase DsbD domain-containing protein [Pyrinomonadaceae bacterium]